MNTNQNTIHVFGGAQRIGRWFVDHVFLPCGYRIIIWDLPQHASSCEGACSLFVSTENSETMQRGVNEIALGHGFLFGLPAQALTELYPLIAPHIPDRSPTLDLSSKFVPGEWFEEHNHRRFDTHKLHPLFGTINIAAAGQRAIFQRDDPGSELPAFFAEPILRSGIEITKMSRREHGEAMMYVQAQTHFVALATACALDSVGHKPSDFKGVRTPPYSLLATLISRIVKGSPSTYASLQDGWEADKVRKAFLQAAHALDDAFSNRRAQTELEKLQKKWTHEADEWKSTDDVVLKALQASDGKLHELKTTQEVMVAHDGSRFIIGRINEVHVDHVEILNLGTLLPTGRIALLASPQSQILYHRQKHTVYKPETILVSRGNLKVLDDQAREQWIRDHVQFIEHTITVTTRYHESPQPLLEQFTGIVVTAAKEPFHNEAEHHWKHTFDVLLDPRKNHKETLARLQAYLDTLLAA